MPPQSAHLTGQSAGYFYVFMIYNRYFRHDRSMLSVTGLRLSHSIKQTGMDALCEKATLPEDNLSQG